MTQLLLLIGLFLIALVFGGVLLKIARLAKRNPPRHSNPNAPEYFSDENFPLVADRELGVWNRPDHHFLKHTETGRGRLTTEVWFDRYGARVAGPGHVTPDNVDIIVVGESNTWGQGTAYEMTYAAVLGQLLGMSVANLGLIASNGVQDLLVVGRFIRRQPKLVVYGMWEEHFASNVMRCPNIDSPVCLGRPVIRGSRPEKFRVSLPRAPHFALSEYRRWYLQTAPGRTPSLWPDAYWTARVLLRQGVESYFPRASRDIGPWRRVAARGDWPRVLGATLYVLSEMKRLADSVGARLLVPYLPFYFENEIVPPPPEVSLFARRAGITLVSLHALWARRKLDGSAFVYEGEGHLNVQGHRDVAEALERALRSSESRTRATAGSATPT